MYEDTSGLKIGDAVVNVENPLSVELGPGLLSSIYDGIQRPLAVLVEKSGSFISRGITVPGLDRRKKWTFEPPVKTGDRVGGGDVIGTVPEYNMKHRIMIPPGISGTVMEIRAGSFSAEDTVCVLDGGKAITLMQRWPVRKGRPYRKKLDPALAPHHRPEGL